MILKRGAACYQSGTAVKACRRSTPPQSHPANWTVSVIIITQERTGQRDRDTFCSGKIHSGCLVQRGKTPCSNMGALQKLQAFLSSTLHRETAQDYWQPNRGG